MVEWKNKTAQKRGTTDLYSPAPTTSEREMSMNGNILTLAQRARSQAIGLAQLAYILAKWEKLRGPRSLC